MKATPKRQAGRLWWHDFYGLLDEMEVHVQRIRSDKTAILRLRDLRTAVNSEKEIERIRYFAQEILNHCDDMESL